MINKTIFLKVFFLNFIVHLLYLRQQVHGNQNFMSGKVQPPSFSWEGLVLEREHLALRKGSTPFRQPNFLNGLI